MRKRGGENLRRIVPGTGISHYGLDARQKSALFGHGGEAPQRELRRSVVDDANDEIGHFCLRGLNDRFEGQLEPARRPASENGRVKAKS
jgi:hypothetical protein